MLKIAAVHGNEAPGPLPRRWVAESVVAVYLGLSVRTLQGWRLRNQGPPFRRLLGGSVRYDMGAVETWIGACDGGGVSR